MFDLRFEEKGTDNRITLVRSFTKNFGLNENSFFIQHVPKNIYKSSKRKYYLQHDPKYHAYKKLSNSNDTSTMIRFIGFRRNTYYTINFLCDKVRHLWFVRI